MPMERSQDLSRVAVGQCHQSHVQSASMERASQDLSLTPWTPWTFEPCWILIYRGLHHKQYHSTICPQPRCIWIPRWHSLSKFTNSPLLWRSMNSTKSHGRNWEERMVVWQIVNMDGNQRRKRVWGQAQANSHSGYGECLQTFQCSEGSSSGQTVLRCTEDRAANFCYRTISRASRDIPGAPLMPPLPLLEIMSTWKAFS